jgi:hypothetical protein
MKLAVWLLRLMLTVVLISGLTIYTTYYIVDGYIQQLLRQLQIQAEGPGLNPAEWMTGWLGLNSGQKGNQGEGPKENGGQTGGPSENGSGNEPKGESGDAAAEHGGALQPEENAVSEEDDALPVMGRSTDEPPEGQDPIVMSEEELKEKKNQLSAEDKALLMDLLLSKLPEDELLQISAYLEDGLTGSEMRNIQQVIAKHLNEDEYEQVMAIIDKYAE